MNTIEDDITQELESAIRAAIDYSIDALNNVKPNWLDRMPLSVSCIDVMEPNSCPLHYAFGDFWEGYWLLTHEGYEREQMAFTALWHWDELSDDQRAPRIARLTTMWREVIAELRSDRN